MDEYETKYKNGFTEEVIQKVRGHPNPKLNEREFLDLYTKTKIDNKEYLIATEGDILAIIE